MVEGARSILAEIEGVLQRVAQAQVDDLVDAILDVRQVIVYGLGREGLAMRGFAMRLMHLGIPVAVVGDMTTPPIGAGDLFLVACGPGYLSTVQALMAVARAAGAQICMITAQPQAELPRQADKLLVLPAQTMAEGEGSSSGQAMGSAFEQAMSVCLDAIVPVLQARTGQTSADLRRRHTNME
jgi:6-phospho-3-hexuloisomerase